MKYTYITIVLALMVLVTSCQMDEFAEAYPDPSKIANTTIERQYTGFFQAGVDYVVPAYWNYFVTLRITLNPWTQSIGWTNTPNQYIPGSAGVDAVWDNYYGVLAQYREFEKVYDASTPERQAALKVFKQTADVYLYFETSRMVDLFGTMPFFEAGRLSQNGGNYIESYPVFDDGEDIYAYMLDELKAIADDFAAGEPSVSALASLAAQDMVNQGDFDLWKRFTNSLRLRLLTRVSGSSSLSSKASTEIAEILGNPGKYPVVENNDQNVMIDVYDINSPINSKGFNSGINSGGWAGDDAPKAMIDYLLETGDPRLRILFEPGLNAEGVYIGLDPLATGNDQETLLNGGTIAFYNRTTTSLNQFFPGVLVNAAEVSLLKAEAYLKSGDDAAAQAEYEKSIVQSTDFYMYVNGLSADRTSGTPDTATMEEYDAVFSSAGAGWSNAGSEAEKLDLIGKQKWVHFNIIQPYQNWAEVRRLDAPMLEFWVDNSSVITNPPLRWNIPGREITFNEANYMQIQSQDELGNKLFWDVK
jgi:hypothetical protein